MSDMKLFVLIGVMALCVFGVYQWCAKTRVTSRGALPPQKKTITPRIPDYMLPPGNRANR